MSSNSKTLMRVVPSWRTLFAERFSKYMQLSRLCQGLRSRCCHDLSCTGSHSYSERNGQKAVLHANRIDQSVGERLRASSTRSILFAHVLLPCTDRRVNFPDSSNPLSLRYFGTEANANLSFVTSGELLSASESESETEEDPEDDDSEEESCETRVDAQSNEVHAFAKPRLLAPIRDLIAEAVSRGYAKYNTQGLARATSNPKFVAAQDVTIVNHYSAIIRGIVNYYSFVNKKSSLWKIISIYRKSCALTLARKYSLRSADAAYNKFGPHLRISQPDREGVTLFYPTSLKTTGKFNIRSVRYSEVTILQEPHDRRKRGTSLP